MKKYNENFIAVDENGDFLIENGTPPPPKNIFKRGGKGNQPKYPFHKLTRRGDNFKIKAGKTDETNRERIQRVQAACYRFRKSKGSELKLTTAIIDNQIVFYRYND